jgi:hypothetical protein
VSDERPQPLRRHFLARRVHRREVGGRGGGPQVVALDDEVVATSLATQSHARSRCEFVREPLLVEPHRVDLARVVADARRDDRQSARATLAHGPHHDVERDLLLAEEVRDLGLGRRRLVAEGGMLEQIGERAKAELPEPLRHRRPHAGEHVECTRQPLRMRRRAGLRPRLGRVHAREPRRRAGCRHHDQSRDRV